MKLNIRLFLSFAVLAVLIVACKPKSKDGEVKLAPGTARITVEEVLQTGNYTYIKGLDDGKEVWLAVSRQEVAKGEVYYFAKDMEMENFTSKELKRTFEKIYFVQAFSKEPIAMVNNKPAVSPGAQKSAPEKVTVKVEPIEGSTTIAQVFEKRNAFAGKQVKIHAQVVKVNTEIMGMNWLHIQDGTDNNGDYDLTVTTKDIAQVGDFVLVEGNITLDKDFGAGYAYAVIMENAKVVKK